MPTTVSRASRFQGRRVFKGVAFLKGIAFSGGELAGAALGVDPSLAREGTNDLGSLGGGEAKFDRGDAKGVGSEEELACVVALGGGQDPRGAVGGGRAALDVQDDVLVIAFEPVVDAVVEESDNDLAAFEGIKFFVWLGTVASDGIHEAACLVVKESLTVGFHFGVEGLRF